MKFKSESSPIAPSASMAHKDSAFSYLIPSKCSLWIIDSGASDYMTCLSHLFHTYDPYSDQKKVHVAYGSFAPIVGKGSIFL